MSCVLVGVQLREGEKKKKIVFREAEHENDGKIRKG